MPNPDTERMIEKRVPSPFPLYAVGLFWLLYAFVFPLYRIRDFLLAAVLSVVVFLVCRRFFPAKTVWVAVPEAFAYSGDEAVDRLLRDGRQCVSDIEKVCREIGDENVRRESGRATAACGRIFDYVAEHPETAPEIRRFVSYHLPTVLKMLTSYENMEEQGVSGENIQSAMTKIENVLKTVADAFEAQLDKLFAGEALDISTDITVLEGMLTREGLSGSQINDRRNAR